MAYTLHCLKLVTINNKIFLSFAINNISMDVNQTIFFEFGRKPHLDVDHKVPFAQKHIHFIKINYSRTVET